MIHQCPECGQECFCDIDGDWSESISTAAHYIPRERLCGHWQQPECQERIESLQQDDDTE